MFGIYLYEIVNLKSTNTKWSEDEVNSLVEFILLMGIGEKWPTHQFWCSAGEFVKQRTNSRHLRSGINYTIDSHNYSFSLIAEVVGYLLKKFKSPVVTPAQKFFLPLSMFLLVRKFNLRLKLLVYRLSPKRLLVKLSVCRLKVTEQSFLMILSIVAIVLPQYQKGFQRLH